MTERGGWVLRCRKAWVDTATGTKYRCTLNAAHDGKCRARRMASDEACSVPGCTNLPRQAGMCVGHHEAAKIAGDLPDRKRRSPGREWPDELRCTYPGCVYRAKDRRLCIAHYNQLKDAGQLPPKGVAECKVEGCSNPARRGGCCFAHTPFRGGGHHTGSTRKPTPQEWASAIEAYVAFRKLESLSPQSIELRTYHLRRLGREIQKPPFEVTMDDLVVWIGSHQWSPVTTVSVLAGLTVFYRWAVRTGRMDKSPAADIPKPKVGQGKPHPVHEDDFQAALLNDDPRTAMAIRLAGDLGMRRSEVAQVHRDDLTQTSEGWLIKIIGKGNKERVIPISTHLATDLLAWIETSGANGWAFPVAGGGHMSPHWMGRLVSRALPEGYTMHKLRHRALTQAYRRSKDIILTSKLAGHSSVATTQSFYVEADYTALRAIVEGIAS